MDRSGYARGTLAPREGMQADVPPLDPRPLLTMRDMMGDMQHGAMGGMARCDARRRTLRMHGHARARRHRRRTPKR